jgi:hypothetical protein
MGNLTTNGDIKIRLQIKLLIGILILETMLMAATILVVERQMRDSILDEFLKRGLSVTRNLAAVNNDFITTYNYVKIEQNLERVVAENNLLYATIVYFDGEIAGYRGQPAFNSMIKFLEFDKTDKNGVAESTASAPVSAQPKRSRR